MALDNYAALIATLNDWLVGNSIPNVADFIALAEADFNRTLRLRQQLIRVNMTIKTPYWPLPQGFLAAKDMRFTDPSGIVYHAEAATLTEEDNTGYVYFRNPPLEIAIIGEEIQISPPPLSPVPVELVYWAAIPALSTTNTSNWLLTMAPDLYLYGSLLHSAPYLREDERLASWGAIYSRIIESLLEADQKASYSGSPLSAKARPFGR